MIPEELPSTVVALSAQIPVGDVHPVIVKEHELAVWRDSSGGVHLWEDRCPHRGMRLSFGFVRDDRLTCLYHGWEYGPGGSCKRIPAHPDLEPPETLCATRFSVAERNGMVILNGTPGDDGRWYGVRSVFVDQPEATVRARLPNISDWQEDGPIFRGKSQNAGLALAVQSVSARETALHLSTTEPNNQTRAELARALVSYRNSLNPGLA